MKVKKNKINFGFTLVELLVVISIIGILAAITVTGFTTARKSARDTARKSDLNQYRVTLESYSANNSGKYPDASGNSNADTGIFQGATNSVIVDEYLPSHIEDPISSVDYKYTYLYIAATATAPDSYLLNAKLETGGFWVICSIGKSCQLAAAPATCTCP